MLQKVGMSFTTRTMTPRHVVSSHTTSNMTLSQQLQTRSTTSTTNWMNMNELKKSKPCISCSG
jgi:hypothetical protein